MSDKATSGPMTADMGMVGDYLSMAEIHVAMFRALKIEGFSEDQAFELTKAAFIVWNQKLYEGARP